MSVRSPSDLIDLLKDAGEVVVYNGVSSYGILERGSVLESTDDGGMSQKAVSTLLIATDAFTDLRVGGRIVVNGDPYRIDPPIAPEDDGALTRLTLAKVPA